MKSGCLNCHHKISLNHYFELTPEFFKSQSFALISQFVLPFPYGLVSCKTKSKFAKGHMLVFGYSSILTTLRDANILVQIDDTEELLYNYWPPAFIFSLSCGQTNNLGLLSWPLHHTGGRGYIYSAGPTSRWHEQGELTNKPWPSSKTQISLGVSCSLRDVKSLVLIYYNGMAHGHFARCWGTL